MTMTTTKEKSSGRGSRRSSKKESAQEALLRGDEEMTQHLINLFAQNINPWRRDWTTYQARGEHRNLLTGTSYKGSNPAILELWMALRCYTHPLWIGAGQAKQHRWHPRKGTKGCAILMPVKVSFNKRDEDGNELKDSDGNPIKSGYTTFKYTKIFNVHDIQGIDEEAQALLDDQILAECDNNVQLTPTERLEGAERVLNNWSVPTTWNGNKAFYSHSEDTITMPTRDQFHTSEGMYSTWAHEQIHSTGHSSRLKRDMSGPYGTTSYAREELVAELGAFLVCKRLQISSDELNHVAYLKTWIEVLKEGPDVLRKALADASKAANLICEPEEDTVM